MPLIYTDCPLYGLKSKKLLKRLLRINNNQMMKQPHIASLVSPYIDKSGKPRLIEPPHEELKIIQKRIKNCLGRIIVPDNVDIDSAVKKELESKASFPWQKY